MKSAFKCAFTGAIIEVMKFGPMWVGLSTDKSGGFVTTGFKTRRALDHFLGLCGVVEIGEPLATADRVCPYLKKAVAVVQRSDGWVAVSVGDEGGYTTTPFWSERHLEYFLSTRAGVPPVFWNGDVQVRDRVPPPPPTAVDEEKSRREMIHGHAEEILDRVGLDTGILRPKPMGKGR